MNAAVVADRWPLMRVGLARAVTLAGLRVVGQARDLSEAADLVRQLEAGLIVVGDTDTATATVVRRLGPDVLVVTLVRKITREVLAELLGAGVGGVSLRSATIEELTDIVRRALAGERAVAPALVPALVGWSETEEQPPPAVPGSEADPGDRAARAAHLTSKERQVLVALAGGASNQQIAEQLYLAQATVKTHLAHIYVKLGVSGRHEALSRAVALGIVH